MIEVCLKVLNGEGDVACLNETLIALIPKIEKPIKIEHFWPIKPLQCDL